MWTSVPRAGLRRHVAISVVFGTWSEKRSVASVEFAEGNCVPRGRIVTAGPGRRGHVNGDAGPARPPRLKLALSDV